LKTLFLLHRTYRTRPPGTRAHILGRYLTCPFLRLLRFVPTEARSMLEIGAGHGLFSRLVAARGVRAVAVEPDIRKIGKVEGVRYVAAFDQAVRGRFDVVAIVDVLYAIPLAAWDDILRRALERLTPGGVLLVKEMDPAATLKNRWNAVQEFLTMRVLGITMGETFNYESREAFAARLKRIGFAEVSSSRIDFGYPHPHIVYAAKTSSSGSVNGIR
jgi:2-polyprenyl-3-methyl-5-hydroxy-6-metoxy-1,4-benzoquinol methylase